MLLLDKLKVYLIKLLYFFLNFYIYIAQKVERR